MENVLNQQKLAECRLADLIGERMIDNYTNIGIHTITTGKDFIEALTDCGTKRQQFELARAMRDAGDGEDLRDVDCYSPAWKRMIDIAKQLGCIICEVADGQHNGAFLTTPDVVYYVPIDFETTERIYGTVRAAFRDELIESFESELEE